MYSWLLDAVDNFKFRVRATRISCRTAPAMGWTRLPTLCLRFKGTADEWPGPH